MQFILAVIGSAHMTASRILSRSVTLENRLILACARVEPNLPAIEDMVKRDPDWQEVVRNSERWGVAPVVYANLRREAVCGCVPASVAEQLRHAYRRDAIRSVTQHTALSAILLRFSESGIPVIVLKGAALGALVYPSPALRTMGDLDFLVHGHDLNRIDKLLRTIGYATTPTSESYSSGRQKEQENPRYFGGTSGSIAVEIYNEISLPSTTAVGRPGLPILVEDFWKRAQTNRIASVEALTLSLEDHLLHLAIHFGAHLATEEKFLGYVRTLCDITEVCRGFGSEIDWSSVVTRSQTYHIEKYLHVALDLARDLTGASVPASALKNLRAGSGQLPFENELITAVARHEVLSEHQRQSLVRNFLHELTTDILATRHARDGFISLCRHSALCCWNILRTLDSDGDRRGNFDSLTKSAPARLSSKEWRNLGKSRPSLKSATTLHGELAVTYDPSPTDGVGAQLQRVYGLYALSRGLNVKYVHTPLVRVEYQGLMPLLAGHLEPDFATRYNAFFSLPSDDFDLAGCERIRSIDHLDQETVDCYREHAAATGHPVLLQALSGYGYTDRHPECYYAVRAVSPYRGYRPTGPVRVCMHVRRGDNVPPRKDRRYRLLSNAYYLRVCSAVIDVLKEQEAPFVVRLHTEMPTRPYTLHPGTPGLYFDLEQPSTIGPEQTALEDFEVLPNLETVLNVEAREALDDFATADVLILSLSSFSYLGGLLNPHGLIIYAPWWHPPLPDWLVASESGELDTAQLRTHVADSLRRRDQIPTAVSTG
jgi:hypothetical protein